MSERKKRLTLAPGIPRLTRQQMDTLLGARTITVTGDVSGSGVTSIALTLAASQPNLVTAANLTTIGTLVAGAVPSSLVTGNFAASRITAGTLGAGNYIIPGDLTLGSNADTSDRFWKINAAAETFRGFLIQTAGVNRLGFLVDDGPESGSDAGSAVQFNTYLDNGSVQSLFSVARAAANPVWWQRHQRIRTTVTPQLTVQYDATNFVDISVASNGFTTFSTNDTVNDLFKFSSSVAVDGATPTTTAGLQLLASATGKASMRIPHGSAPSSPVNGDMWTTTAGLFVQINGSTVGPLS